MVVSDVVTLKERGKYQGIIGSMVLLARSIGPTIGGVFTEKASWRWCFWINVPLTALSMGVIIFLLPLKRVKGGIMGKIRRIDWYGSILTLAWVILFLLGLSWAGNQYPWISAAVLAPFFIGLALLAVFIVVEWKLVALPLIPLRIFRSGHVAAGMLITFLSGMMSFATLYYLPTYFQVVRGDSPLHSGLLLLPLVVIQVVSSFTSGLLVSRFGDYYWNLVGGFALWAIGLGLLSTVDGSTSVAKLVGYQLFNGVGAGQTFQPSLVAIQAGVDRKDMAAATGMRNFMRMLGGTLAVTICSTIVNNIVRNRIGDIGLTAAQAAAVLTDPTQVHGLSLSTDQQQRVEGAYGESRQPPLVFDCCAECSARHQSLLLVHDALRGYMHGRHGLVHQTQVSRAQRRCGIQSGREGASGREEGKEVKRSQAGRDGRASDDGCCGHRVGS